MIRPLDLTARCLTRIPCATPVVAFLVYAGPASAQVCIDGSAVIDASEPARALTVADFDADGDLDLGIAGSRIGGTSIFSVVRNSASRAPAVTWGNVNGWIDCVASADVDQDLDPDIVFVNRNGNQLGVYRNTGSGSFDSGSSLGGIGPQPTGVVLADFDGDGDMDAAISCFGSGSVNVRRNVNGAFFVNASYLAGAGPSSVDAADLDLDGDVDLVVTNETDHTVSVLLNAGDGTFGSATAYAAGSEPSCVVIQDFDGDGNPDLAVSNRGSASVSVFSNLGAAVFGAPATYGVGAQPISLSSADLDGDGDLDLASADQGSDSVSVLSNQGNGMFAGLATYGTGRVPMSIRSLDLDRDGHVDLTVACRDSRSAWILWNRGNGTFPDGGQRAAGLTPKCVAQADVDGDGDVDLVTSNEQPSTVSVLVNQGGGLLAAPVAYAAAHAPADVVIADFDGDLDPDLAVASSGAPTGNVGLFVNSGTGSFTPDAPFTVGTEPVSLACGDVDGDGDPDLVAVERQITAPNFVRVVRNQGDGTFAPPVLLSVGLGTSSVVLADLDHDGDLDIAVALEYDWLVQTFQNQGNGTFVAWHSIGASFFDVTMSLASGDFDGDGDLDLALARSGLNVELDTGNVVFLWNTGAGAFGPLNISGGTRTGPGTPRARAADLDGDGIVDLLVTTANSNAVFVLSKFVDGGPTERIAVGVGSAPYGAIGADVDGDGDREIASANRDSDTLSILDNVRLTGIPFCFGDGSGTACPCGNAGAAGRGCATSFNALGAQLAGAGRASVAGDTFVLTGTGLSPSVVTFFQGTVSLNGGTVFGDGLRCAGGSVLRLGAVAAGGGTAQYPWNGALAVSIKGAIPATGALRHYQVWYRNAAAFCTVSTFNLTNGLSVVWEP